jgi:hypothetical protein
LIDVFTDYNVKVILYLRRQDEFLNSLYNQEVKSHDFQRTGPIEDLFCEDKFMYTMDFYTLCETWESVIGPDNFNVLFFNKHENDSHFLFRQFFHLITDIDITQFSHPEHRENQSLSGDAVTFLRGINTLQLSPEERYFIIDYLMNRYTVEKTVNFIDASLFKRIKERYSEDNKRVFNKYGVQQNVPHSFYTFDDFKTDTYEIVNISSDRKLEEFYIPVIAMLADEVVKRDDLYIQNANWIRELKEKLGISE